MITNTFKNRKNLLLNCTIADRQTIKLQPLALSPTVLYYIRQVDYQPTAIITVPYCPVLQKTDGLSTYSHYHCSLLSYVTTDRCMINLQPLSLYPTVLCYSRWISYQPTTIIPDPYCLVLQQMDGLSPYSHYHSSLLSCVTADRQTINRQPSSLFPTVLCYNRQMDYQHKTIITDHCEAKLATVFVTLHWNYQFGQFL